MSNMSGAVMRCTSACSCSPVGTSPDLEFDFIMDWGIVNVGEGRDQVQGMICLDLEFCTHLVLFRAPMSQSILTVSVGCSIRNASVGFKEFECTIQLTASSFLCASTAPWGLVI